MINNILDYNCKVIYKGLSYFSSGSPLVSEFSNNVPRIISIKEEEKLPVELMDIYKKVLTDESITLYKGKLKFNLNEGGIPEFTENFNNKVSVNLSTGEVEKDFEFKEVFEYSLTTKRSIEDIMLFLIKVASIKNEYVFSELARDSSFLTKSGYYNKGIVMSNVFHLITDNIEGFEKLLKSGNKRFFEENIHKDTFEIGNEGKLNKVIQLPKFALQYIKKKKLEQCYDIFKNISNDFDGNALNILFNFFENMKIFVKANERERVLGRFSNILYNLMKDYDYKITDLLNYLIRQNFYYSKTGLFCFPLEQIQLLEDYLNMCKKYSMKYEKFEQHLEKAHNIVAKNVKVLERTKGKENLFKESVDSYQHLEQKSKEYSILVPKDIDDLIQEGNFLHHCVGSYADKIINKDSKIFFMRLNKEIDKPFVTIEIDKNNQFVEARCIYNNIPEPEIMSFIKSWVKSLKSKGEV